MNETLTFLGRLITGLILVVPCLLYLSWAAADARKRGKSALLVCFALVVFFPWGLIAWLVFRPTQRSLRTSGEFSACTPGMPGRSGSSTHSV